MPIDTNKTNKRFIAPTGAVQAELLKTTHDISALNNCIKKRENLMVTQDAKCGCAMDTCIQGQKTISGILKFPYIKIKS